MFSRPLRLPRTGFDRSRGLPRKATPHFSISYGILTNTAGIGVIVPKKIVKSSVERHQLKRRIREVLHRVLRDRKDASGATIIVSARSGAASLKFDQINDELSRAFKAILLETSNS